MNVSYYCLLHRQNRRNRIKELQRASGKLGDRVPGLYGERFWLHWQFQIVSTDYISSLDILSFACWKSYQNTVSTWNTAVQWLRQCYVVVLIGCGKKLVLVTFLPCRRVARGAVKALLLRTLRLVAWISRTTQLSVRSRVLDSSKGFLDKDHLVEILIYSEVSKHIPLACTVITKSSSAVDLCLNYLLATTRGLELFTCMVRSHTAVLLIGAAVAITSIDAAKKSLCWKPYK